MRRSVLSSLVVSAALLGCAGIALARAPKPAAPVAPEPAPAPALPTPAEEARAFALAADDELRAVGIEAAQAAWDYQTDITDAHEAVLSAKSDASMAVATRLVQEAAKYKDVPGLDADTARLLHLIRVSPTIPAPVDAARRAELAQIVTELDGMYGKGEYCRPGETTCRDLGQLEQVLADAPKARSAKKAWDDQVDAYYGWRTISPPMRDMYTRFVTLGNEGARDIGFADMSELWRSGYDMTPAEFDGEVERLWQEVKPLYDQLHCYARAELSDHYGKKRVPTTGPIPAHVLGNMWSQSWEALYPLLAPYPAEPSLDVTAAMQAKGWEPQRLVKTAEGFFTSLGLDPLPQTFYERSMFVQPTDREVVCHASAWDVSTRGDLRIKMCIKVDEDSLLTLHHELGHNYYYQAYRTLPYLYQSGANDGFHEGIGDTLALSVTPAYLKELGILDTVSESPEANLNKQMSVALAKIAFLPFGRMMDKWRWQVFSGEIPPERYNEAWWALVKEYQGLVPLEDRGEQFFDPGAKYHIPANTPYMRYFLAAVLQFQFHEALCKASGHTGPLYTCSIHGSKEAGARLQEMLAMGASKPWPDALEAITGSRTMDARPIVEYFQPLMGWLAEENKGRTCGW